MMNCHNVTRLLPLHAGGDLAAEKERAVSHHLLSCDECRRVAGEYEESRQMLRLYEPPEFDAAFHEGIRRTVMREVNNHHAAQVVPASLVARLFRIPPAYVFRAALLLVACALMFYVYRPRPTFDRARREIPVDARPQSVSLSPTAPRNESPDANELTDTPRDDVRARATTKFHRLKRVAPPPSPMPHREALTEQPMLPAMTTALSTTPASAGDGGGATPAVGIEALPYNEDEGIEVAVANSIDAAPEVLRIELQTSDPNIRIIWLAPQKESSPPSNTVK